MLKTIPAKPRAPQAAAQPLSAAPTIAKRKTCNPNGTGLSHYVLMDKKGAQ